MPFGKPLALYDQTVIRRPVPAVDPAWVARTAPGGQIRVPIYTLYHPAAPLTLTIQHNGVASGRFGALPITALPWEPGCPCGLGPVADAAFFVGLMLPGVRRLILHDGAPTTHALWLEGPEDSWVEVTRPQGIAPRVQQGGGRRLWDEVMQTWRRWEQLGRPRVEDLGVTVTPSAQWAWAWSSTTPLTASR
ncbi:hypothetical protein [Actinomadura litoris]|uniref:hypothetical protein n=1 Tax=Actinomadura litoris TaxID=2678616 RepID=UPI001FA6BEC8|nr:hypothetical protein [Actinomadura litoris]